MAVLLHRLGRWCARRPWAVIGVWVALFALTISGMAAFAKPLSNEFSIPGSRFEQVLATLKTEVPEAGGIGGTVVFRSSADGSTPFTDTQRDAIRDAVERWNDIDTVRAIDPFVAQEHIDGSAAQLDAARAELANGQAELDSGAAELAAGRAELEAGQGQLDGAKSLGLVTPEQAAEAQAEIDAGMAQIEAGEAELEAGRAELAAGEAAVAAGERVAALSEGMRLVTESDTVAMAQIMVDTDGFIPPETMTAIKDVAADLNDAGVPTLLSKELTEDSASPSGPPGSSACRRRDRPDRHARHLVFGSLIMALVGVGSASPVRWPCPVSLRCSRCRR